MADKKLILIACVSLAAGCIGFGVGRFAAKQAMDGKIEYVAIKSDVQTEPYKYAPLVRFSVDRKEMPVVIEKLDYAKYNNGTPAAVRARHEVPAIDEKSNKHYKLIEHKYYKVSAYPNGDKLKVEVPTDKGDMVELTIAKVDVEPITKGKWNKVRFKDGKTGWVEDNKS